MLINFLSIDWLIAAVSWEIWSYLIGSEEKQTCRAKEQNQVQFRTSSLKRRQCFLDSIGTCLNSLTCRQFVSVLINTWVRNWTRHWSSDLHWKHETILLTDTSPSSHQQQHQTTTSSPDTFNLFIRLINNWHNQPFHKTNQ